MAFIKVAREPEKLVLDTRLAIGAAQLRQYLGGRLMGPVDAAILLSHLRSPTDALNGRRFGGRLFMAGQPLNCTQDTGYSRIGDFAAIQAAFRTCRQSEGLVLPDRSC